jgi:hypothetical protein
MALTGWRWLDNSRFQMILETAASALDASGWPLLFLDRLPTTEAYNDELIGRFTQRVLAADLIADSQVAVVQDAGQIEAAVHDIPNLKAGKRLDQALLNELDKLKQYPTMSARDTQIMDDIFYQLATNLLIGNRQRMNQLACGMMIDQLHYDRLGVKFDGVWGMPSALKVVTANVWDDAVNGTPVTDILTLSEATAPDTYGMTYDRITMSSKAFTYMVNTAEFKNRAISLYRAAFATSAINVSDRPGMLKVAGQLLDKTIELYDAVIQEQQPDGSIKRSRVLPQNVVLLSNSQFDKNPGYMDMANCVVTESLVGSLAGNAPEGLNGGRRIGPVGYYEPTYNPPSVTAWCVSRCIGRKFVPESTATLTVGNLFTTAWPG